MTNIKKIIEKLIRLDSDGITFTDDEIKCCGDAFRLGARRMYEHMQALIERRERAAFEGGLYYARNEDYSPSCCDVDYFEDWKTRVNQTAPDSEV